MRRAARRAAHRLAVITVAAWAFPGVSLACSTCMDPREGTRTMLGITVFLSLLPLLMMVGIGAWLWRRVQQAALAESAPVLSFPAGVSAHAEPPAFPRS